MSVKRYDEEEVREAWNVSFVTEADYLALKKRCKRWEELFGTAIMYLKMTSGFEIAAEKFMEEYKKAKEQS